jgi:hypothetical protein
MSEIEADLKATAHDLAADAARIREIELAKTTLDLADPRIAELSRESERLTAGMAHKARAERALADDAQAASD